MKILRDIEKQRIDDKLKDLKVEAVKLPGAEEGEELGGELGDMGGRDAWRGGTASRV